MITRAQFAQALLQALGFAVREGAVNAIVAWETMENTQAENNPLATTWNMEGQTPFNTLAPNVHVWNYPSIQVGLEATVNTLRSGYYPALLQALATGTYQEIVQAIDASPWGTQNVAGVVVTQSDLDAPIASSDTLQPPAPAPDPAPAPRLYVVQPGDTLWGIAARFFPGSSAGQLAEHVQAIYNANSAALDATARAHGYSSSNGGSLLWPGEHLVIPGA